MLITRDEKCLIRCVFREEMGRREERRRRRGEEVVSFRLSLRRQGPLETGSIEVARSFIKLAR